MKSLSLLLFLILCLGITVSGQKTNVEGLVLNKDGDPLANSSIVLLNPADSTLVKFAFAEKNGKFELKKITPGEYILQIAFLGFENYSALKTIPGDGDHFNLGIIMLEEQKAELEGVEITADHIPIMIKDDTIVYNANAFKTKEHAPVEDLLKKLPGVEVERDGSIKAQGKTVDKIYVDGKEFFGDDPQIATKNLPADAVDKVEVYDKQSEMAEFTGIDDGLRSKTINLELKEDKKQGIFGEAMAGYGTADRFDGKLSYNKFTDKVQLSVLGMANNINKQGFSLMEYLRFSGGFDDMMGRSGGGMQIEITDDDAMLMGMGSNQGINTIGASGINFNYDFKNKAELRSNYFYNFLNREEEKSIFRDNYLDNLVYKSSEDRVSEVINHSHNIQVNFKYPIDSMQRFSLKSSFKFRNGDIRSYNSSENFNTNSALENDGTRSYFLDRINYEGSIRSNYTRRLGKWGRNLSISGSFAKNNLKNNNEIESINSYYLGQINPTSIDSLLQSQKSTDNSWNYRFSLSYTEPISSKQYISWDFERSNFNNDVYKNIYDHPVSFLNQGILNAILSNEYERIYLKDQTGLQYRYTNKDLNFSIGLKGVRSHMKGELKEEDRSISNVYYRLLPSMNINYELNPASNFRLSYNTNYREPSIFQLQPVIDNTNPLSLYFGNPSLEPEYQHRTGIHYHLFDNFSFTYFSLSSNVTYTQNKISNAIEVDSLFRQIQMPVNSPEDYNISMYSSFSTPLKFIYSKINLSINGSYGFGQNMVNQIWTGNRRLRSGAKLSLENRKKEIIDARIGLGLDYSKSSYPEKPDLVQRFLNKSLFTDVTWQISESIEWTCSFTYQIYDDDQFAEQSVVPLWNMSLSYLFLKSKRAMISLNAFDLLDQNTGINRYAQLNFTQEERYLSLGRYIMVSLKYNLSKTGAKENGMMMFKH